MAKTRAVQERKPRLLDIAEVADVSTATVSRVLNGKPGVGDEVRSSVLAALDMLGYERPAALRHKTSGLVGVVVPELNNPIFPAFAQGLETRLSQHGYSPLLCTQSPGGTTEDECIDLLLSQGVSGIILVSGLHADSSVALDRYHDLRARGIPLAFVNGWAEGVDGTFVATDDAAGMDGAVRHLSSLGHTRIGLLIGPDRLVPAHRKIAAFRTALSGYLGIEDAEPHIFRTLYTLEGGHAAAEQLVDYRAHRADLRLRPDGPRCHPGGPWQRVAGTAGRVRDRVRRLAPDRLRRPPAHHRPPARRRHVPGRGHCADRRTGRQSRPSHRVAVPARADRARLHQRRTALINPRRSEAGLLRPGPRSPRVSSHAATGDG